MNEYIAYIGKMERLCPGMWVCTNGKHENRVFTGRQELHEIDHKVEFVHIRMDDGYGREKRLTYGESTFARANQCIYFARLSFKRGGIPPTYK